MKAEFMVVRWFLELASTSNGDDSVRESLSCAFTSRIGAFFRM